jgi:hypothetical protein
MISIVDYGCGNIELSNNIFDWALIQFNFGSTSEEP